MSESSRLKIYRTSTDGNNSCLDSNPIPNANPKVLIEGPRTPDPIFESSKNKRAVKTSNEEKAKVKNEIKDIIVYEEKINTIENKDIIYGRRKKSILNCNDVAPQPVRRRLDFGTSPNWKSVGFLNKDFEKLTLKEIYTSLKRNRRNNHAIVKSLEKKSKPKVELSLEKKYKPKVALSKETIEEWKVVMGIKSKAGGTSSGNEEYWRIEREKYANMTQCFIEVMKLIQGDRKFSEWDGTVMDSVVGAFLTQNVTDHMSSSAFISLAARFSPKTDRIASTWCGRKNADLKLKVRPKIDKKKKKSSKRGKKKAKVVTKGYHAGTDTIDWDEMRRYRFKYSLKRQKERKNIITNNININDNNNNKEKKKKEDSVDWEGVRSSDVGKISEAIHGRGQENNLSERIHDFLNRIANAHGRLDLEWLRDVSDEQAKDFLLSIFGLGLKSVECIRLLSLHQVAFPVDANVSRICVRLGWVPLKPLPESVQIHLLKRSPMRDSIQRYLWPRLCKLDQRTLYELHYQMITFGKVFCTKKAPNCNACPLRSECKHFASSFASAKLPLPWHDHSTSGFADSSNHNNLDPIIEEPSTPSREESPEMVLPDIEDLFCSDSDEIPSVKLDMNSFAKNVKEAAQENNGEVQNIDDFSRALVALPPSVASIPLPILKNLGRLRTIHDAYELQDNHHILKSLNFEERIPEDPSPYLLIIWDSDKNNTSESCVPLSKEERNQYVQGSVLIPSRTAMRGSFPLNGTYFQVNEVFADHYTAEHPIKVSRDEIWRLRKSPCLFGTSVSTIFKGLSTKTIQLCFWRGFICLREFDRATRTPQPLSQWFHKTKTRSSNKTV